jgi:hypothetical protein
MSTDLELSASPSGEAVDGLSLRLRSPHAPSSVLPELRNVGNRALVIGTFANAETNGADSIAWLVRAQVYDAGGQPLPSSGPIVKSGAEPRIRPVELAPGESILLAAIPASSIQVEVDGEWIVLDSRPGTYRLEIVYELGRHRLPGSHWSGAVTSNRIELHFE